MSILDSVIAILAPHPCILCGREGKLLCDWCVPDALPEADECCFCCKRPSRDSRTCRRCRLKSGLGFVWVRTNYEYAAAQIVHRMKFEFARSAAKEIADAMAAELPFLPEDVVFVHVPTANVRVRQRGFDQSKLIARELSRKLGRRHRTLLARSGKTRQLGAKREDRQRQLAGAYRALSPDQIKGAHIVLVDDVVTTGATLDAAVKALRGAGARRIDAAVFARAV